jgi:hypothetical protein
MLRRKDSGSEYRLGIPQTPMIQYIKRFRTNLSRLDLLPKHGTLLSLYKLL